MQIARRIEEVRAQKMAAELRRRSLREIWASGMPLVLVERIEPGVRSAADLAEQVALDLQILGDRFDDPVAAAKSPRSSSKLPGVIRLAASREEGAGLLLRGGLDPLQSRRVAVRLIGQNDVEQERREAGIGEVGRDPRPHGSGAKNRHTAKWFHLKCFSPTGEFTANKKKAAPQLRRGLLLDEIFTSEPQFTSS